MSWPSIPPHLAHRTRSSRTGANRSGVGESKATHEGQTKARGVVYDITPVTKPRQTQRDKWMQRPPVVRYRAFADECRLKDVKVPKSGAHVIFHIPMPKSWTLTKRTKLEGQPHTQKPDVDNLAKSLLDALYGDDSCVWDIRITKRWAVKGAIEVIT